MAKLTNLFLAVIGLSFLAGCSSDDPEVIILDLTTSVALTGLSGHTVTYEKTSDNTIHSDGYCPPNDLRDDNGNSNGDWSILGNDLTTNPTIGTAYTYTTNGELVEGTIYNTNTADSFKVTDIIETLCL